MFKKLSSILLILFLSTLACLPLKAKTNWGDQVQILNESNTSVPPTPVGQWYPVVLVEQGARYAVKIYNPLDERIKVVISIAGVSPFTGRRSTRAHGGIVLGPGEQKTIKSWMPHKKSPKKPLASPQLGDVHKVDVAVFRETTSMPLVAPYRPDPPASTRPDKWVPPNGTPFYPLAGDPEIIVHRRVGPGAPVDPL